MDEADRVTRDAVAAENDALRYLLERLNAEDEALLRAALDDLDQ